ncbi:MlaE family ABC transporter permease [Rickettsiella massiliensis]|uniref:MlaE family ABC transporter permease n=1 Tax=Rickettsiella massiliensis TaxID=676517 RepID=UPI00029B3B48|nr:ABC transporter permease [Rickettsiella massiliensis]
MSKADPTATIRVGELSSTPCLECQGAWTFTHLVPTIFISLPRFTHQTSKKLLIHLASITAMDSYGAWQLYRWTEQLTQQGFHIELQGFDQKYQHLFEGIAHTAQQLKPLPIRRVYTGLAFIGKKAHTLWQELCAFLTFTGQIFSESLQWLIRPHTIRGQALVGVLENSGLRALGIIAILAFMIGIVLTYQMGLQLKNYGASLFIIDLLGLSILREFAPLITAIMIAGRSGSAFTAQLGLMKIKEEIDVLQTMGVRPNQLLILPRILGLMIALPLLTIWADIFGILGGMFMTQNLLHIGFGDFLRRFPQVVNLSSLLIGLGKTPIFALIIASVACFQGLRVQGSADSVGQKTTRSVVQAIFFIIIADALFSILFSTINI